MICLILQALAKCNFLLLFIFNHSLICHVHCQSNQGICLTCQQEFLSSVPLNEHFKLLIKTFTCSSLHQKQTLLLGSMLFLSFFFESFFEKFGKIKLGARLKMLRYVTSKCNLVILNCVITLLHRGLCDNKFTANVFRRKKLFVSLI
jgi:hypothetical protein